MQIQNHPINFKIIPENIHEDFKKKRKNAAEGSSSTSTFENRDKYDF